jgi:hypothetical protein
VKRLLGFVLALPLSVLAAEPVATLRTPLPYPRSAAVWPGN